MLGATRCGTNRISGPKSVSTSRGRLCRKTWRRCADAAGSWASSSGALPRSEIQHTRCRRALGLGRFHNQSAFPPRFSALSTRGRRMSRTPRKIWSQGDLDGACFLYSMMNAAQALYRIGSHNDWKDRWSQLLTATSKRPDFLDWQKGTIQNASAPQRDMKQAQQCLKAILPGTFIVKLVKATTGGELLDSVLDADSVFVVDNNDHWYCVVDADDDKVYAACSDELNRTSTKYSEGKSPTLRRTFNVAIPAQEFNCREMARVLKVSRVRNN